MFHFSYAVLALASTAGPVDVPEQPLADQPASSRESWSWNASPPSLAAAPPIVFEDPIDTRLGRDGWYIQLGGAVVTTTDSDGPDEDIEFDEGFAVPVAIGHRFGADDGNAVAFDLELEGLWTDQDVDDEGSIQAVSDVTGLGGHINGVVDFALGDTLSIYAGAGIGAMSLDVGTESDALNDFDEEDGPFLSWQAKAGLRLWASEGLAFSLGYRFVNIDDAEIDDDLGSADFDLETQMHMLELGVRFGL